LLLADSDSVSVTVIIALKFFWMAYFAISEVLTTKAPFVVENVFVKA
jgi:hypothetical protein